MLITNYLLLPWKPIGVLLNEDYQKICRAVLGQIKGVLVAKSHSFLVKWSLNVRISNFHGNRPNIFQFWFRHYTLWPEQIDCAKFCWDWSRNGGGDSRNGRIGAFLCKIRGFLHLHGNGLRISQFRFCHYTPCLLQIDHAKFRWDRLRNTGGDSRNSPKNNVPDIRVAIIAEANMDIIAREAIVSNIAIIANIAIMAGLIYLK